MVIDIGRPNIVRVHDVYKECQCSKESLDMAWQKKCITKELSTSYIYREIYCWVAQI